MSAEINDVLAAQIGDIHNTIKEFSIMSAKQCTQIEYIIKTLDATKELEKTVNEQIQSNLVLAGKVDTLTEKFDRRLDLLEAGQRSQGERIGTVEKVGEKLTAAVEKHTKDIEEVKEWKRDMIAKPGKKLDHVKLAVICSIASGLVALVLGWLGHMASVG